MKQNTYGLQICSERGSVTIVLLLVISAILAMSATFLHAAITRADESRQSAILDLAGRSVLAEYDRALKDRYGLFGVKLSEGRLKQRIAMYTAVSYEKEQGDLFHRERDEVRVELSGYQLMDLTILEDQIQAYMKYQMVKKVTTQDEPLSESMQPQEEKPPQDRVLRNETISKGLPTSLMGVSPGLHFSLDELTGLMKGWDQVPSLVLTDQYLLDQFRHHHSSASPVSFYRNELEYILFGSLSDDENHQSFLNTIQWIRTSLNAAYLYQDPEKRNMIMEAAQLLTPGPEAVATQAILIASWAALEGNNDRLLLDSGEPVPVWKDDDTWAVTLEHLLENRQEGRIVVNQEKKGWYYQDYLHVLLLSKEREEKLMRALDLIQLNLNITVDRTFSFQNLYGGFRIRTAGYDTEQRY